MNRDDYNMQGGRYERETRDYRNQPRGNYGRERGWWEKAADEVSSIFGDEDATRRREHDNRTGNFDPRNNAPHRYPDGYQAREASPYYPLTNRIYEPDDRTASDRAARSYRNDFTPNRTGQRQETRAHEIMTRNVTTVHPNDTAQLAARMMRDHDCGAIPVVDRQGRIIGMITDRDIAVRLVAGGVDIRYAQVQDAMTDEVFACYVDDSLESCLRQMSEHQVRRLPVVDNYNRVVGIISQGDLAQHAEENHGARHAFSNMVSEVSERSNKPYR